jgi:hypothetical protein
VQGALTTAASGTTANLAFSVPVTAGNIVVGAMLGISPALLISVTDDKEINTNLPIPVTGPTLS